MPFARPRAQRSRLAALLLGLAMVVAASVSIPVSDLAPGTSTAEAATAGGYDVSVGQADCALLGRAYAAARGCSRDRCVDGALLWRVTAGAEVCALPGQPQGYGYAATVDARHCAALNRRWIPAVNYCASVPDRSRSLLVGAPQCVSPATVYFTLSEQPGRYDECLTRGRATAVIHRAAATGTTPAAELAHEQRLADQGPAGVLVVGDSVTWRGNDELTRLAPELTVDGQPARRPSELTARVSAFRAHHGPPTGLVVELGSISSPGYTQADLAGAVASLPSGTPVLLVLPYVVTGSPAVASAWSQRFGSWMRSVAAARPDTCVADWPAYAESHPGLLQDGIHVRNDAETDWASWLVVQWERCLD